jgi:hypothetical protein
MPEGGVSGTLHHLGGRTDKGSAWATPGRGRGRYQRSYSPRRRKSEGYDAGGAAVAAQIHSGDWKVSAISEEMRAVVESEWPELVHKLPPKKPQG